MIGGSFLRPGSRPLFETLETRLLLSGVYEVWGGDTDYTPLPEHWDYYYNIDQQDYTKLGAADHSQTFRGTYDYYVLAACDAVLLDAVLGTDGEGYAGSLTTGNTADYQNCLGRPDGQYAVVGCHEGGGTYRGFVVFTNPGGVWSGLTVYLDDDGPEEAPFEIDLTRIRYEDSAGREIDYDFSSGTMEPTGVVQIPGSAVHGRGPGEESTTFLWEPIYGNPDPVLDTSRGIYRIATPQPDLAPPPVWRQDVTVDGDPADWADVGAYLIDANRPGEDDVSRPGSDIEYAKLCYGAGGSRLNVLVKVADAISEDVWYRLFFDRADADYPVAAPGNFQVDVQHHAGAGWDVVSQGWNSDDPADWYPIDEQGTVAVSGAYIEASLDVAALGLSRQFFVFGATLVPDPYTWCDGFYCEPQGEAESLCALGAWGPVAAAPLDWTFRASASGVRGITRDQAYYGFCVGAGRSEPAITPEVWADWFTGNYGGAAYQDVLVLGASVHDEINDVEVSSGPVFLGHYDPLTTTVDLRAEVEDGVIFTASYRINGGPWQELWTHVLAEGQMPGFADLFPYVTAETGFVGGVVDANVARTIDYEGPGAADDEYEYEVDVSGYELENLQVTTPWGEVFQAADVLPPGWDGEYFEHVAGGHCFEAYTENGLLWFEVGWEGLSPGQWAALDTGETHLVVTHGEGVWTATTDFDDVTQPTEAPTLLSPTHWQTDVPLLPTIEWQAWVSPPAGGGIWLDLRDSAADQELYEVALRPGATSWQVPQPLAPDTLHEAELLFADDAVVEQSGVAVHIWAETESDTRFTTTAPGVTDVRLERGLDYNLPSEGDPERCYSVGLAGIALTGLTVVTPWEEEFDLDDYCPGGWPQSPYVYDDGRLAFLAETSGDGQCRIDIEWLLTESQWNALDTARTAWLVPYQGGSWVGTADFEGVAVPDEAAHITLPGHLATGVPFYPTFTWDPWASPGPGACISIDLKWPYESETDHVEDNLPPTATQWVYTGPLEPDTLCEALPPDTLSHFGVTFYNAGVVPVGGEEVTVTAWTDSDILFRTAASGLAKVWLERGMDYQVPGAPVDDARDCSVVVAGYGLTGLVVTTPWGQTVDSADFLPPGWSGEYGWTSRGALEFCVDEEDGIPTMEFSWDWLSDNQWAALDIGQTTVTVAYQGGLWSRTLDFAGAAVPDREPWPTCPLHRQRESQDVTAAWAPWADAGPDSLIWVEVSRDELGGDWEHGELLPATAVSWDLPHLPEPCAPYEFEIDFVNLAPLSVEDGVGVQRVAGTENDMVFVSGGPETLVRVHPGTGHVYFLTGRGTWDECEAEAQAYGGHLVTLNSAAEETWLRQQYGINEWFWIGFNDTQAEGTWVWTSGEPATYTNWAPGQPNNGGGGWEEDAAVMNWSNDWPYWPGGGTQWNDVPLDHYYPHDRGIVELPAGATLDLTDDYGNTSAEATLIAVPTTLTACLGYPADIDFLAFVAAAGQAYDIRVDLPQGGLEDSTLWLYGSDGWTLLAHDDDGGFGWGSRIVWTAPAAGTYYLAVDACELENRLGEYTLHLEESALVSDAPAATVLNPGPYVLFRHGRGGTVSEAYTGAVSEEDAAVFHYLHLDNPLAPGETGAYFLGEADCGALAEDGSRLYLADDANAWGWLGHAEVVGLDLPDAGDPVEAFRVPIHERDADSLCVAGRYLYVGTQPDDESIAYLEVYDLSAPSTAALVGISPPITSPVPSPAGWFDPEALVVEGDRAYILHEGDPVLSILDVSDPSAPSLLGQYLIPGAADDDLGDLGVCGTTVLVGANWDLVVIDATDPAHVQVLTTVPLTGSVEQIRTSGGLALVGTAGTGATILDLTDPAHPQIVQTYTFCCASGSSAAAGGYVYVPTSGGQMAIFCDAGSIEDTWTGQTNTHWEDDGNWSASIAPQEWTQAIVGPPAAHEPTLYENRSVLGLDLRTSGWTVSGSGHTLTVGSGGMDSAGTGTNTVEPVVAVSADATWTIGDGNTLVLNGSLSGGSNTLTKDGGGTLVLSGGQDHGAGLSLIINGGTVRLGGLTTLVLDSLAMAPTATLDLAEGNLIVNYSGGASPFAEIAAHVASGLNLGAGYWNGAGIRSSAAAAEPDRLTAVGVIDNQDPHDKVGGLAELEGVPVPAESVLVKYTWWGDANLDGVVNTNDYDLIDRTWLLGPDAGGLRWAIGDFNGDGILNTNDYDLIDRVWLLARGQVLGGAGSTAAVPLPDLVATPLAAAGVPAAPDPLAIGAPVLEPQTLPAETALLSEPSSAVERAPAETPALREATSALSPVAADLEAPLTIDTDEASWSGTEPWSPAAVEGHERGGAVDGEAALGLLLAMPALEVAL